MGISMESPEQISGGLIQQTPVQIVEEIPIKFSEETTGKIYE